jgi:serpin B
MGVILLLIALVGFSGCLSTVPDDFVVDVEVMQSDLSREIGGALSAADLDTLVGANTAFATDLYRWMKTQRTGNFFFSPYSISQALAMTYAGARGQTEQQMSSALHFDRPQEQFHPAFSALDLNLRTVQTLSDTESGQPFQLSIANAIWGQQGYVFLDTYLDLLARYYSSGMRLLDFFQHPEACRLTINRWVSDETQQRIAELIPSGLITQDTLLVLTNAVYFQASWQYPFRQKNTQAGSFYRLDGSQTSVPMMMQSESFPYVEAEGFVAVELPYVDERWAMLVLMPTSEQFDVFENTITLEWLDQAVAQLQPSMIQLTMPKFLFETDFSLKDALKSLGMTDAFSGQADFSGIVENGGLAIDDVIHKAYVAVDESGTEAAAATAVVMIRAALPIELSLDHPFIFMIRDRLTKTVLFMGRVMDPGLI